jgi:ERCC4-related helicase/dsRNA-specific ribonuclease
MELIHLNYEKLVPNELESFFTKGTVYFDHKSLNLDFYSAEGEYDFTKNVKDIKLLDQPSKITFASEGGTIVSITYDENESVELYTWKKIKDHIEDAMRDKVKTVHRKHIISEPKDYQVELFKFAKERNSIIFLETGLGKTYIAIMLVKDLYGEPLNCNIAAPIAYEKKSNKKVIFLFKTITLLLQQAKVLKNNTKLRIYKIYGGDNTPTYLKFRASMSRYDIICATPESVYRYLTFGYLKLDDIGMIILDECHHTKEKDYYNRILKQFIHFDSNIRIVGLTASPSFDTEKTEQKIMENIQTLCNNMNSSLTCPSDIINEYRVNEKEVEFLVLPYEDCATAEKLKLFIYNNFIHEILKKYKRIIDLTFVAGNQHYQRLYFLSLILTLFSDEERLSEKISGVFEKSDIEIIKRLEVNELNKEDAIEMFKFKLDMGKDDKMNFSREIRDIMKKLEEDLIVSEMFKYVKTINYIIKYLDIEAVIEFTKTTVAVVTGWLKELSYNYPYDLNWMEGSFLPKLKEFKYKSSYLACLEDFLLTDNIMSYDNKTVVFTNQRIVAKLYSEKFNPMLGSYKCSYVVGYQSRSNFHFSEEELKANTKEFRENPNCAILFATNVIEEGFDLPQCNNVVNLAEIKTIKEYIQKSGRARKVNSTMYICCDPDRVKQAHSCVEEIKLGVSTMKKIITENSIKPRYLPEKYVKGINYYETTSGARVYSNYASTLVNEFGSKLYYDGYSFLKAIPKTEEIEIEGKTWYMPYLALPSVLDNMNLLKITDGSRFDTFEGAKFYFERFSDNFHLKAVKLLHQHKYLDDNFTFYKNYDELIHLDSNTVKVLSEPSIKIKPFEPGEDDYIELIAHKLELQPGYFDFNYGSENKHNLLAIVSDSQLTYVNFEIFIHSFQLLKLYYFNQTHHDCDDFQKKPKIDFTYFSKVNVKIEGIQTIRIPKSKLKLIDFFYTYILYFSTDAETFFYHNLYSKKFEFSDLFYNDEDKTVGAALDYIFKNLKFNEDKKHLKAFQEANISYAKHPVKFTVLTQGKDGKWDFDYEYLEKVVTCIKEDIISYYNYILFYIIKSGDDKSKLLTSVDYYAAKVCDITERHPIDVPDTGCIYRNLINFTKYIIHFNSSSVEVKGSSNYRNTEKLYYQHVIEKCNTIIDPKSDFSKCMILDYNQKIMKYKINIKHLGYVHRKLHKREIKKCTYLPKELLQKVRFATLDQLYIFTLFPIILQKVQNNLIYYYQANCLRQRFPAFNDLQSINMRLLVQALNSKTTMEFDNYERLEFLGDSVLKFLSSFEVFKILPKGNKDLLFSKRRFIENNKFLFQVACREENSLADFLFTTPMTLKKVSIPGFTTDESLMFCIGNNRSFSKNCIMYRLFTEEKKFIGEGNNQEAEEDIINLLDVKKKDEEVNDKTIIQVDLENNCGDCNLPTEYLPVPSEHIADIVEKKIEIIPSKTYRNLYVKVLADGVESLVGFLFMSQFEDKFSEEIFASPSAFLKQLGVLTQEFDLKDIEPFWLDDLANPDCKFTGEEKLKYFNKLLNNGIYEFKNPDLLHQACTHSTYLIPENFIKQLPYVVKSYQRLAFLGEALVSFFVSLWVYRQAPEANESTLHKLKICGINQHIISLVAIDLGLRDCILHSDREMNNDLDIYRKYWDSIRNNGTQLSPEDEKKLDENYIAVSDNV